MPKNSKLKKSAKYTRRASSSTIRYNAVVPTEVSRASTAFYSARSNRSFHSAVPRSNVSVATSRGRSYAAMAREPNVSRVSLRRNVLQRGYHNNSTGLWHLPGTHIQPTGQAAATAPSVYEDYETNGGSSGVPPLNRPKFIFLTQDSRRCPKCKCNELYTFDEMLSKVEDYDPRLIHFLQDNFAWVRCLNCGVTFDRDLLQIKERGLDINPHKSCR